MDTVYLCLSQFLKRAELATLLNHSCNSFGDSLYSASFAGHAEIVRLLLQNRANVNTEGGYYDNPLQAASVGGHRDVVRLLVDHRAEIVFAGWRHYESALEAASDRGHGCVVEFLLDRMGLDELQYCFGYALRVAVGKGNAQVVGILLEAVEEDSKASSTELRDVIELATGRGNDEVLSLLLGRIQDSCLESSKMNIKC